MIKKINLYDDDIGSVEYIQHMGEDLTVVNSARVSFGKEKKDIDGKDRKLIQYLCRNKHTSTLEHNVATFRFVVPLFVRSQHHRHRTWSYNEISRRYTDINLKFYLPKKFRTQHKSNRQASNDDHIDPQAYPTLSLMRVSELLEYKTNECLQTYETLIDRGVCREQARMILPQNLYTEYYGTVNLNNLLKFIDLRTHEGAQWEIQRVAEACLDIATELWPITVNAYREQKGKIISGVAASPKTKEA
jgi:thymidylate synthase (FAD)